MVFICIPEDALQRLVASFDLVVGPSCNPKQKVLRLSISRQLRILSDTLEVKFKGLWLGIQLGQGFPDDLDDCFIDFDRDCA